MADYTREDIYNAMRRADAAGDGDAVRALAAHLKTMDAPQQAPAKPRRTVADRVAPAAKSEGWLGSAVRAIDNGALPGGMADRAAAAMNAVVPLDRLAGRDVHSMWGPGGFAEAYRHNLAGERATSAADAAANPRTNTLAGFAGAMASPLNKVAKGNALARLIMPAAAYGAVDAGGNAQGSILHRAHEAVKGAAEAAAGAVVGDKLVRGAGNGLAKLVSPKLKDEARRLLEAGVRLTPGQILGGAAKTAEDKAMSWPGVGSLIKSARRLTVEDWNRSLYNRVLQPIGKKYDGQVVGYEGVGKVEKTISDEYQKLAPHLNFSTDSAFENDIANVIKEARELPPTERKQLRDIMANRLTERLGQHGQMRGDTFLKVESELSMKAAQYSSAQDAAQRELGARLHDVVAALRNNIARQNPQHGAELANLNKSWAALVRLQKAAVSRASGDGIVTPNDLLNAARTTDKSVRKGAFAKGEALMQREGRAAKRVIPSETPNSGTLDRAAGLAAIVEAPKIGAAALAHPLLTAGAAGTASLYTRPGLNTLRALALKSQGRGANALAATMRKTARRAAPVAAAAGKYAGASYASDDK